jgi:hypothetical protein
MTRAGNTWNLDVYSVFRPFSGTICESHKHSMRKSPRQPRNRALREPRPGHTGAHPGPCHLLLTGPLRGAVMELSHR